jgi:hypothetical protein
MHSSCAHALIYSGDTRGIAAAAAAAKKADLAVVVLGLDSTQEYDIQQQLIDAGTVQYSILLMHCNHTLSAGTVQHALYTMHSCTMHSCAIHHALMHHALTPIVSLSLGRVFGA